MSVEYSKDFYCKNCEKRNSGFLSTGQIFIFFLLILLFIIPGILYWALAKPNRCFICGLKRRHQVKK